MLPAPPITRTLRVCPPIVPLWDMMSSVRCFSAGYEIVLVISCFESKINVHNSHRKIICLDVLRRVFYVAFFPVGVIEWEQDE